MARASYQHIPNIVLGKPKKSVIKKKKIKKAVTSSPSFVVPPKPVRPTLKAKFS